MAYFRCVGGVGGGAVLTLTYSSEFYGETITATDGTKTVTKVAPSTGTMDITLPESGTWVVSATIDGHTYSTTVAVDIEYTATLEAIPDGSTVTPTDDIQTWLKCAGITDKTTYTTLSDVLGDTETLIMLCADSNACDYMARSTTWASGVAADSTAMLIVGKYNYCGNKLISNATWCEAISNSDYFESVLNTKIPIMTSDTTPSGKCSMSSSVSSTYAYSAVNGGNNTPLVSVSTPQWWKYEFPNKVICTKFTVKELGNSGSVNPSSMFTNAKIQGSNDDSSWTDLYTITQTAQSGKTYTYTFFNDTSYKYYRLYITAFGWSNTYGQIGSHLQFYGRTDNANYIPLVPVMTSNTTPSGVASAGEENARAYYAFDGNPSTKWYSGSGASGTVTYIGYQFPSAVEISAWGFAGNTDSPLLAPTKVVIQKSDDGVTYTDVQTFDNLPNDGQFHMYTLDSPITTAYIRAETYKRTVSGNTYAQLSRLQFYREPTVGDVLIHSAVEDSIFYMDDGSPVPLCGIPVGDTIDVDLEAYKGQTLTLVSTVAKDPTNLSNDFSMNVRITPNITEIYLMPVGALYWYGYVGSNLENLSTANGWATYAGPQLNYYHDATYATNKIVCENNSSQTQYMCGVGSSSALSASYIHFIANRVSVGGSGGVDVGISNGKTRQAEVTDLRSQLETGVIKHLVNATAISTSGYAIFEVIREGKAELYGMWYE